MKLKNAPARKLARKIAAAKNLGKAQPMQKSEFPPAGDMEVARNIRTKKSRASRGRRQVA